MVAAEPRGRRRRRIGRVHTAEIGRRGALGAAAAGILLGLCWAARAEAAEVKPAPAERVFELAVVGGSLVPAGQTVRVRQGESVRLVWTADSPVVLHLHGYDIERRLAEGETAEMAFHARATGRFPVHLHGPGGPKRGHHHGPALLYVEVRPP